MPHKNDLSLLDKVNWEYLKRFKVCAESKSFKEAARIIGTTPNVVVTQLNNLEEDLGFPLFERINHNRTNRLTFQGERILQLVSIAALYLSGSRSAPESGLTQEKIKQKLKIFTTPGLAISFLPQLVDAFLLIQPLAQIEVITSGPAVKIQEDEIVIRSDVKDQPEIIKEILGEVSMDLYASRDYLLKMGIPHKLEDLKQHKVFTFSSTTYGNTNWALLSSQGFPVSTNILSNSVDFLHEMCARGHGIVELANIYKRSPNLIRVLENVDSPKHTIYLAFSKSVLSKLETSEFIKFILNYCQTNFRKVLSP